MAARLTCQSNLLPIIYDTWFRCRTGDVNGFKGAMSLNSTPCLLFLHSQGWTNFDEHMCTCTHHPLSLPPLSTCAYKASFPSSASLPIFTWRFFIYFPKYQMPQKGIFLARKYQKFHVTTLSEIHLWGIDTFFSSVIWHSTIFKVFWSKI